MFNYPKYPLLVGALITVNIKGVPIFRKGLLFDVGGNYIPVVLKINHCFFSFSDSQAIGGEEFPTDRCINDLVKTKEMDSKQRLGV